jgi:hypothetical protein
MRLIWQLDRDETGGRKDFPRGNTNRTKWYSNFIIFLFVSCRNTYYSFCSGLEAFAQYSQLKSMMGELDLSLEYIEKALINVRSKDEV